MSPAHEVPQKGQCLISVLAESPPLATTIRSIVGLAIIPLVSGVTATAGLLLRVSEDANVQTLMAVGVILSGSSLVVAIWTLLHAVGEAALVNYCGTLVADPSRTVVACQSLPPGKWAGRPACSFATKT